MGTEEMEIDTIGKNIRNIRYYLRVARVERRRAGERQRGTGSRNSL